MFWFASHGQGWAQDVPAFLPSWFAPAFEVDGVTVRPISRQKKDGIARVVLESADASVRVTVDHHGCTRVVCEQVLRNGLAYLNNGASRRQGRLLWVNDTELRAAWADGGTREENFLFRVPEGITAWIIVRRRAEPVDTTPQAARLLGLINRWRADILARGGDEGIADWSEPLLAYAHALRLVGDKAAALALLRRLAKAPSGSQLAAPIDPLIDPVARMDLAELEDDPAAARAHARLVLEHAEDPALAKRASRLLGVSLPDIASLKILAPEPEVTGLQLVLLALPPVDVRLLADAARAFEQATAIPVRLQRLATPVAFDSPDRFLGQLQVEQDIAKRRRRTMDFTGWDRGRYPAELRAATAHEDALTRFMYDRASATLLERPVQYRADPLLDRLRAALTGLRARDRRVMYVGVTEAGLYRDDALFLFSQIRVGDGASAILSYGPMLARNMEEPRQSRPRLVARLTKELVVASLAQLDLPRPDDPTDPYAVAPSLARLDAKTLTVSPATRAAIEALR